MPLARSSDGTARWSMSDHSARPRREKSTRPRSTCRRRRSCTKDGEPCLQRQAMFAHRSSRWSPLATIGRAALSLLRAFLTGASTHPSYPAGGRLSRRRSARATPAVGSKRVDHACHGEVFRRFIIGKPADTPKELKIAGQLALYINFKIRMVGESFAISEANRITCKTEIHASAVRRLDRRPTPLSVRSKDRYGPDHADESIPDRLGPHLASASAGGPPWLRGSDRRLVPLCPSPSGRRSVHHNTAQRPEKIRRALAASVVFVCSGIRRLPSISRATIAYRCRSSMARRSHHHLFRGLGPRPGVRRSAQRQDRGIMGDNALPL